MQWVVVETKTLHEDIVVGGLARLQIETRLPKYPREIKHARRVEIRHVPLFPRYLFAQVWIDDWHQWAPILRQRGVRRILGDPLKPHEVAGCVIDAIAAPRTVDLAAGERIRFRGGCYRGIEAVFKHGRDDQVCCTIVFMGHDVETWVHRMDVERVAA